MTVGSFWRIKCDICKKQIGSGDFIGIIGEWPGAVGGIFSREKTMMNWPHLKSAKIYCKACFNKNFKKTSKK